MGTQVIVRQFNVDRTYNVQKRRNTRTLKVKEVINKNGGGAMENGDDECLCITV